MATAIMVMTKTSGDSPLAGARRFVYLSKQLFFIFSSVYLITVSQIALAKPIVIPTFEIRGVVVDNSFDSVSETGYVTTISPGVIISSNGAKSDFLMVYAYDDITSHDLEQDDREVHELELSAEFRHKPNQWTSYVRANNRLTNRDIDGVQSTNPDIIDVNSEELFTFDIGTTYSERLSRNIQYSAGLNLDYSDEEDSDSTSGREVILSIDNFISENILTWRAQARSNFAESEDDDDQIDELELIFNYRFDQTLSAFLELTATETDSDDSDELNDDSSLVGLRWSPTRRSFVRAGIGKRGDDDTYDLDARISKARSLYSASYSESVRFRRDQLFDLPNDQFGQSTQQSTAITPVLRQRGDIAATFTGVRSTITFSIFRDKESDPNNVDDEVTTGGEIKYDRRLSPRSNLSLTALSQETEFTEEGTLEEFRVSYQKSTSKTAGFEIFVSNASFDSTNEANDYDQASAGATYRVTF